MNIEGVLNLILVLIIHCLFIYVLVSALFTPYEFESLRGERRKVEFNGETFEFRFWEDPYGIWCGVFVPQPPEKVLWVNVNNDKCIAKSFGEEDPVGWCYNRLTQFYADREIMRKGEEKLKQFLADNPEL